jgi:hypothetical protein
LPELKWENIEIKKLRAYKTDSADYQITVSFRNSGRLPTAFRQAQLVKIVRDDRVSVELTPADTLGDTRAFRIIEEKPQSSEGKRRGFSQSFNRSRRSGNISKIVPCTQGGTVTTADFKIRTYKGAVVNGKAEVSSTRGGTLRDREFIVK